MRASSGLGLIVIAGLFACTTIGPGSDSTKVDGPAPAGGGETATEPTGASDPTDPEKAASRLVENLDVTQVAVFQAVQVNVVKSGAYVAPSKRNAPVVAKRPGMLRIYVTPGKGWTAREVTAEVRLVAGDTKFPILRETKTIRAASKDADLTSTFNLDLTAEQLPAGVTFQVALTAEDGVDPAEGKEMPGRFPADGTFEDLGVETSGTLKVVIVPVQYEADGTGRQPDVSAKQLALYKQTMMAWYPTSDVELTTHKAVSWPTAISRNGSGFSNILQAMYKLRQSDKVDDDVYYYGVFAPASSMKTFCQQGCVAGLSTVGDENSAVMRASVGLGFNGQDAAYTMAHELGHAHGREHAPCGGPDGVDPAYPYPDAQIGVWGYDIFEKALISPTKGRDVMAYCPNQWISDYTYGHLFERIAALSTEKNIQNAGANTTSNEQASRWRMASVGTDGALSWDGSDIDLKTPPKGGSRVPVRFLSEVGAELVSREARFFPYDHLPGGVLFVPQEASVPWKAVTVDGFRERLVR